MNTNIPKEFAPTKVETARTALRRAAELYVGARLTDGKGPIPAERGALLEAAAVEYVNALRKKNR